MRAGRFVLVVALLAGCHPAPFIHPSPTDGRTPASPPATPTPDATATVRTTRATATPSMLPSEDLPNGPAVTPPPTGYRRPGVPGQALTPDTTPPGFAARGQDGLVDADGGLWYMEGGPDPVLVHLDAAGAERGRWAMWTDEAGAGPTAYRLYPGVGVYTTMTYDADPQVEDAVSTDVLIFTPVGGRRGWRLALGEGVIDVWRGAGQDLTWLRVLPPAWGATNGAVVAVGPDGTETGRHEAFVDGAAGVRPDGAIGVFDAETFRVLGPGAKVRLEVPRSGGEDPTRRPRMDAQGRFWWWDPAARLRRLDPTGQDGVADAGPAPAVTPPPGEVPPGGLALPGGDRWLSAGSSRDQAAFPLDGLAAIVRVGPGDNTLASRELPGFHHARPIGLAGVRVWVEARYGEETRYGLVDPTASVDPPAPPELPPFPPSEPQLEGRWQHVAEDAPAGVFRHPCLPGRRDAYEVRAAADGAPGRFDVRRIRGQAMLTAVAEHGLVTAIPREGDPALLRSPGFVVRYDPETDHLVGRTALGRPLRLARVPASSATCED